MSKSHLPQLLLVISLFLASIAIVTAGPTSTKEVSFHFELASNTSLAGDWNMYFISLGDFETNNWSFSSYYSKLKEDYINFKKNCGTNGTFYETIYKMSEEERKHKGCTINGTYQEVYCYKITTDKPECSSLIPYKINDQNKLTYKSYYDSYLWDIGRAEFYNHHPASYCHIDQNQCNFTVNRNMQPYNPYVVVLEKLDSNGEAYFSKPIHIPADIFYNESLFTCRENAYCDIHVNVNLNLLEFKREKSNTLNIAFDNVSIIADKSNADRQNADKQNQTANEFQNTSSSGLRPAKTNVIKSIFHWLKSLFS